MNKETQISIVIPCYNEENHIETCVDSLLDNGYPKELLEILIIDGGSIDDTLSIIAKIQETNSSVKLISNKKKKTPFALNLGIKHAQKDYILIASAHSSFEIGYIAELVKQMNVLNADVVGGVMETKIKNETPTSNAIKQVLSNKYGVGNAMFRIGINEPTLVDTVPFGLYKTSLLRKINGYNEKLIRNHDIELSKRLLKEDAKIYLIPSAKCYYYARETFKKVASNNYNNGKWNMLTVYITKDFSSLSIRHFVPLVFVLSIISPLVLTIFFPLFWLLSLAILLSYLAVISYIVLSSFDLKKTTFLKSVFSFISLHFAYGFGSLAGLLRFNKLF